MVRLVCSKERLLHPHLAFRHSRASHYLRDMQKCSVLQGTWRQPDAEWELGVGLKRGKGFSGQRRERVEGRHLSR